MNEKPGAHLGARGGEKDSKSIGQTSRMCGHGSLHSTVLGRRAAASTDVRLQGLTSPLLPGPGRPGGLCRRGQEMGLQSQAPVSASALGPWGSHGLRVSVFSAVKWDDVTDLTAWPGGPSEKRESS